jgi:hypothetical protein
MSQQLVALGCCIDSPSHRDFRDVVLRDLAVLLLPYELPAWGCMAA